MHKLLISQLQTLVHSSSLPHSKALIAESDSFYEFKLVFFCWWKKLPTKILLSVEAQLHKLRDHQCTKLPHNPIGTKIYIKPSETQFRVLLLDCLALYTLVRISRSHYINMSLPVPWVWYLFCPKEWFCRWKCFVLFYLDYLVNFNLLPGSIRCLFILQHHTAPWSIFSPYCTQKEDYKDETSSAGRA